MIFKSQLIISTVAMASALASTVLADPATGWVVTNYAPGAATDVTVLGANTDSPSFTPANGIAVIAGFPAVTLGDGDSIQGSGAMTVVNADGGTFLLQFRIGLFREIGVGPTTGDGAGYTGYTIEHDGFLKETAGPTNPFSSFPTAVQISEGVDPENDVITADNFTAQFTLSITRDGDSLDIDGVISDGGQYHATFTAEDYLPANPDFSFNRIGFLSGQPASAETVQLNNVDVTVTRAIPEPSALLLAAIAALAVWRTRRNAFAEHAGD